MVELAKFPGGALIEQGLFDATNKRLTVPSLLVSMNMRWLQNHDLAIGLTPIDRAPEIALYELLQSDPSVPDPYSRYNSLLRQLVSFQRAYQIYKS